MHKYLVVESRSGDDPRGMVLALELADRECQVNLWIMQDALQHLQYKRSDLLKACIGCENIKLFVDSFSVRQRGCKIADEEEISVADISLFSEHLMEIDRKAIWH